MVGCSCIVSVWYAQWCAQWGGHLKAIHHHHHHHHRPLLNRHLYLILIRISLRLVEHDTNPPLSYLCQSAWMSDCWWTSGDKVNLYTLLLALVSVANIYLLPVGTGIYYYGIFTSTMIQTAWIWYSSFVEFEIKPIKHSNSQGYVKKCLIMKLFRLKILK